MSDTPIEQWADAIEAGDTPRVVQVYRQTASTQDHARRLIADRPNEAHGGVIVAEHQTHGRGRLGRSWHSPAGSALTVSLVHKVDQPTLDRVTFAAAVAVAEALDVALVSASHTTAIKWPNDVYVGGRKIAGILVDVIDGFAIVGLGVNIHLREKQAAEAIEQPATSLAMCGAYADRLAVLLDVLKRLDECLHRRPEASLHEVWRKKCAMFDQDIKLMHGDQVIEGRVIDLDPRAGLVVQTNNGETVRLHAATTTVLP
ncbi:MAG: biotin--[acetyl-CoA-carboxylase] ligase [Planctomycetota bacterium]